MPNPTRRGGDRGGRRPRGPAATITAIKDAARSFTERPAQLQTWTDQDLRAVIRAADALARPLRDELERRADELEVIEEREEDAAAWRLAKGE